MTDIFISYKSERKLAAEHFAEVLRSYGYSVWFDYSLVKGKDFAEQIERQIRASKSVVVLWCSMSIGSRWVREEVHLAHDLGLLIPVKIEPCEIPFGFRLADTIDLSGWDGSPRSHQLDPLLDDLEAKVGRAAAPDRQALIEYERTWRRFGAQPLKAFALGEPIEPDNGGLPSVDSGMAPDGPIEGEADAASARAEAKARARREVEANWPKPPPRGEAPTGYQDTTGTGGGRGGKPTGWVRAAGVGAIALVIAVWVFYQGDPAPKSEPIEVQLASGGTKEIVPGSGESFEDCAECPEMVVVPAGSFMMGSTEEEIAALTEAHGDYFKGEGPQHEARIPEPFAVGKFEVTWDEWEACMAAGGCTHKPGDEGWGRGNRPVINVSWDDAQAYAKWLSEKTGKTYRLLSEAEWEYAARAGTTTRYAFGDSISRSQAHLGETFLGFVGGKTAKVGSYEPNAWGLHDIHGNVLERVEDCWNDSYADKPDRLKASGAAWTTGDCNLRVSRGGHVTSKPRALRSASRDRKPQDYRFFNLGFRLARTLTP